MGTAGLLSLSHHREIRRQIGIDIGKEAAAQGVDKEDIEELEEEVGVPDALVELRVLIEADEGGGEANDSEEEGKEDVDNNDRQKAYDRRNQ